MTPACAKAHALLSRDEPAVTPGAALAPNECGRLARPPAPGSHGMQAPRRPGVTVSKTDYRAPTGAYSTPTTITLSRTTTGRTVGGPGLTNTALVARHALPSVPALRAA